MARFIDVGSKQIDLDDKHPVVLWHSLSWLEKYEPDTPENLDKMKQIKDELSTRAYKVNYNYKYTKQYTMCQQKQWPYNNAAKCVLKNGHKGEHFSTDRPQPIYWA